jgi:hypothetical protein
LRGPLTAPQRSLDATRFTNWLALRVIEEKARHIDALEKARRDEELAKAKRLRELERSIIKPIAPAVPYTTGVPFAPSEPTPLATLPTPPAAASRTPKPTGAWWEALIGP